MPLYTCRWRPTVAFHRSGDPLPTHAATCSTPTCSLFHVRASQLRVVLRLLRCSTVRGRVELTENVYVSAHLPGNLFVSGPQVALGYLFNSDAHRAKFIDNPFIEELPEEVGASSASLSRFADGELTSCDTSTAACTTLAMWCAGTTTVNCCSAAALTAW